MLDIDGFVSETNATNVFLVKNDILKTPFPDSCLPGTTRAMIMKIARDEGITLEERRLSLVEFQAADEVFTTGTMGELSHVVELDGRQIGNGALGPITTLLQALYAEKTLNEGIEIPR